MCLAKFAQCPAETPYPVWFIVLAARKLISAHGEPKVYACRQTTTLTKTGHQQPVFPFLHEWQQPVVHFQVSTRMSAGRECC